MCSSLCILKICQCFEFTNVSEETSVKDDVKNHQCAYVSQQDLLKQYASVLPQTISSHLWSKNVPVLGSWKIKHDSFYYIMNSSIV